MAARTDKGGIRRRFPPTRRGDRFGLLLLLLVLSYLLSAFTANDFTVIAETALFVGTLLLALRTSRAPRRMIHAIISGTVAGSVVVLALVLSHATSKDVGVGIANLWTGFILFITVGVILRRVLEMPTVSLQSIFGAVSAYMIIGLMFAWFFAAMSHLQSTPFFSNGSPANTKTFQYFSFTTLTTLGYGDFTAAQNIGRAVAVMEALIGQIFLATLVARLVASYRAPRRNGSGDLIGGGNATESTGPGGTVADIGPSRAGSSGGTGSGGTGSGGTGSGGTGSGGTGSGGTGSGNARSGGTGSGRVGSGRAGSGGTGPLGTTVVGGTGSDGTGPNASGARPPPGTSPHRVQGPRSSDRTPDGIGAIRGTTRIQGQGNTGGRATRRQAPVKWRNRRQHLMTALQVLPSPYVTWTLRTEHTTVSREHLRVPLAA